MDWLELVFTVLPESEMARVIHNRNREFADISIDTRVVCGPISQFHEHDLFHATLLHNHKTFFQISAIFSNTTFDSAMHTYTPYNALSYRTHHHSGFQDTRRTVVASFQFSFILQI